MQHSQVILMEADMLFQTIKAVDFRLDLIEELLMRLFIFLFLLHLRFFPTGAFVFQEVHQFDYEYFDHGSFPFVWGIFSESGSFENRV